MCRNLSPSPMRLASFIFIAQHNTISFSFSLPLLLKHANDTKNTYKFSSNKAQKKRELVVFLELERKREKNSFVFA